MAAPWVRWFEPQYGNGEGGWRGSCPALGTPSLDGHPTPPSRRTPLAAGHARGTDGAERRAGGRRFRALSNAAGTWSQRRGRCGPFCGVHGPAQGAGRHDAGCMLHSRRVRCGLGVWVPPGAGCEEGRRLTLGPAGAGLQCRVGDSAWLDGLDQKCPGPPALRPVPRHRSLQGLHARRTTPHLRFAPQTASLTPFLHTVSDSSRAAPGGFRPSWRAWRPRRRAWRRAGARTTRRVAGRTSSCTTPTRSMGRRSFLPAVPPLRLPGAGAGVPRAGGSGVLPWHVVHGETSQGPARACRMRGKVFFYRWRSRPMPCWMGGHACIHGQGWGAAPAHPSRPACLRRAHAEPQQ